MFIPFLIKYTFHKWLVKLPSITSENNCRNSNIRLQSLAMAVIVSESV